MFELLNENEIMDVSAGGVLKKIGEAVGYVTAKAADVVQHTVTETALAIGQVATTTASMLTGDTSIMNDYDDYYKAHSILW